MLGIIMFLITVLIHCVKYMTIQCFELYSFNIYFTINFLLNYAILPQACDDFHRKKTLVLRILFLLLIF